MYKCTNTVNYLYWDSLPSAIRDSSSTYTFRRLRLPLATHPSASDSATGWHCTL